MPTLPLVSVAFALSVWLPLVAVVVSQFTAYGGEVTGLPSGWPSRRNCTDATATLSLAFAATGTVPDSVWFAVGLVRLTVGGVVSAVWVGVGVGVVGVGVGVVGVGVGVVGVGVGVVGVGVGVPPPPDSTSTAARFQWSPVGAVSLSVTVWPAPVV